MVAFDALLARYKEGEFDLDEFADQCAKNWVYVEPLPYPETDRDPDLMIGPSSVTVENARFMKLLTQEEVLAIYSRLPD